MDEEGNNGLKLVRSQTASRTDFQHGTGVCVESAGDFAGRTPLVPNPLCTNFPLVLFQTKVIPLYGVAGRFRRVRIRDQFHLSSISSSAHRFSFDNLYYGNYDNISTSQLSYEHRRRFIFDSALRMRCSCALLDGSDFFRRRAKYNELYNESYQTKSG